MASLLRTLDFAAFVRTVRPGEVPADALDAANPTLTLEVEMDSVQYRVTIGGVAPHPAGARYAHTTGDDGTDRLGVVPASLVLALNKDSTELLGRLLFPYAKSQTKSLQIERKDGRTSLVADPFGFRVLELTEPKAPATAAKRASPSHVDGLFFGLARAGMDTSVKTRAPSPAPIIVTQVPEAGPEVRVEIGGECVGHPELVQVVRTAPDTRIGCTSPSLLDVVARRDLTLRGLWSLDPDEIDHIVITRADKTLELIRDGITFRLLSPDPAPISLERGNEYLRDLTDLVLDEVPCQGEVVGQLRVVGQPEGSSEGRELRLTLFEGKGQTFVRRDDDGACLALTDRASWLLDPSASWYDSLEVLSVRADDVLSLVSFGPELGREEVHRKDGVLQLRGGPVDEGLLDATLRTLSPLRADRIAPSWSSAPWEAQLEIRIEARSSGPFVLRIGPRVRGGYLGALAGRRTEFVLSPDVVRTLETSLRSRAPAQWNPQSFTDLSVTAHGVTYRLRRIGGELLPVDDAPRELGPALVEALSGLAPISAVREGGRRALSLDVSGGLKLEGLYDSGDGRPRTLEVELGAQVLHEERSAQLMMVSGTAQTYYVDRAAVLSVLDLL